MRLLILSLLLANAVLMGAIDLASAQSPTSYPWCARSGDGTNSNTCYFTSKEECARTSSGIGVFCLKRELCANSRPRRVPVHPSLRMPILTSA